MPNRFDIRQSHKDQVYFQIVQVGAGANGSHFFRNMCQDIATHLAAYKQRYYRDPFAIGITLVDGDVVEQKNLGNQLFDEEDISEHKSVSLASRYGEHYNLDIKYITSYLTDLNTLKLLFPQIEVSPRCQVVKVLVGMVDNNRSRQLLDGYFYSEDVGDLIYIDAGVEGVKVFNQQEFSLSSEEKQQIAFSGFGGQVVTGFKYRGEVILEPVARVYTNILEDEFSHFPGEGCGDLIISAPQRSATNKMAAQLANNVMNNLFHSYSIYNHVINFNAQTCSSGGRDAILSLDVVRNFEALKAVER